MKFGQGPVVLVGNAHVQDVARAEPTERRVKHDHVEGTGDSLEEIALEERRPVRDVIGLGVTHGGCDRMGVDVHAHHVV
jgi:hypothetical protein